jgi:hypothetical protein
MTKGGLNANDAAEVLSVSRPYYVPGLEGGAGP